MADLLKVSGGVKSQGNLPETWTAPTSLFDTVDRNDGSAYGWTAATSLLTLPSSDLADGYLIIGAFEYEDTSNGRFNPQGKIVQVSGSGNFVGGPSGGYNRDNSEDRSYVRCWALIDNPSASATFQFQWKADADDATGGTVRSEFQVIPLYYSNIGMYSSTSAALYGGTTPNQVTGFSAVTESDTNAIEISSNVVTVKGDNKRYLILGSQFFEGRGGRTQRWHGLEIDGSLEDAAKAYSYYRNASNDESGEIFTWLIETATANRTIEQICYRGDGVAAGDGGADVDGSTPSVGDHTLVVLELYDNAEVIESRDTNESANWAATGPLDQDIAETVDFNDSDSFTKASAAGVNAEVAMDALVGANISGASGHITTGNRWTAYAELTIDGVEDTDSFAGDYLRNNQSSQDTFGWSANLLGFLALSADEDIGVSVTELSGSEGAGGGPVTAPAGWIGFWAVNLDTMAPPSGTATSDERDAEIHGSADVNDERDAEIHGQTTANDERDAEVSGGLSVNDERDAEVHGIDTTNDERDSEIHGQDATADERDAEVHGATGANAERDAEIEGGYGWEIQRNDDGAGWVTIEASIQLDDPYAYTDPGPFTNGVEYCYRVRQVAPTVTDWSNIDCVTYAGAGTDVSDERDAEITGSIDVNDERDAEIHGTDTANDERDAEVHGSDSATDERDSEIHGIDTDADERDATIHGQDATADERDSEIHGSDSSTDERDAEVHGQDTDAAERDAEVHGTDSANAERDATIHGQEIVSGERDATVHGQDTDQAERDAEVTGALGSTGERDAEIEGIDTTNDERDAEVHGQDTDQAERDAEISGIDTDADERDAEISGTDTDADERDAEIHGLDTDAAERDAEVSGTATDSAERDATIHGSSSDNAERDAEVTGQETDAGERDAEVTGILGSEDERDAEITGIESVAGEFSAEIAGALLNPYCPTPSPLTPTTSPITDATSPYTPATSPYSDAGEIYTDPPKRDCTSV
ncbi:MAG: hypothetical protein Tp172MES00d2C118482111_49 [Prokaryotic dsDNA virus sp.]|nr:MAG: hypothetical protein Tp172MES00d2C118482111_49 [Prokaryotic dsDNA virus sp.]